MTLMELRLLYKAETGKYPVTDRDNGLGNNMSKASTDEILKYLTWLEEKLFTYKEQLNYELRERHSN